MYLRQFSFGIGILFLSAAAWQASGQIIAPATNNARQFATLPECSSETQLKTDDAGAIFVSCRGPLTYPRLISAPIEFDYYIIKLDQTGRREVGWGDAGVVKIRNDAVITCNRNDDCRPSFSAPARDGGFWLALSNGRVLKLLPNGMLDQEYLRRYDKDPKSAALFDLRSGQLSGVALQPNGRLIALNTTTESGSATMTMRVHELLPDGRLEREFNYSLRASESKIVAWSLAAENLTVLLQADAPDDTTLPLRRWLLTPDGKQRLVIERAMPAAEEPGFIDPSFYVMGDGKLTFANSKGILKWRADGTPDMSFAGTGFRPGPGRRDFPLCEYPFISSHLSIRGNADLLHFYRTGFQIRGLNCLGPFGSVVTGNGFADTYANPIPIDVANFLVARDGGFLSVVPTIAGGSIMRTDSPGVVGANARADVNAIEYYNETTDHYFITAHEHEVEFVDKGSAGPGWKRTGHLFGAWNIDTPMPGTETVCRYYGDATGGPNSHFYSAEKFECGTLRALDDATPKGKPAWRFERDAFRITVPTNSQFPPNLTPVYRLYNRGSEQRIESNHRYVTSSTEYAAIQAKGWAGEGVHMYATHN